MFVESALFYSCLNIGRTTADACHIDILNEFGPENKKKKTKKRNWRSITDNDPQEPQVIIGKKKKIAQDLQFPIRKKNFVSHGLLDLQKGIFFVSAVK